MEPTKKVFRELVQNQQVQSFESIIINVIQITHFFQQESLTFSGLLFESMFARVLAPAKLEGKRNGLRACNSGVRCQYKHVRRTASPKYLDRGNLAPQHGCNPKLQAITLNPDMCSQGEHTKTRAATNTISKKTTLNPEPEP